MGFREIDAARYADCPFDARARLGLLVCGGNAMTVGWGLFGILWGAPAVALFVRPSRFTDGRLSAVGRCSLCFLDKRREAALSLCGKLSGRDESCRAAGKLALAGLTPVELRTEKRGESFPAVAEAHGEASGATSGAPGGAIFYPAVAEAETVLCLSTAYTAPLDPERLTDAAALRFYRGGDWHKLYLCRLDGVFLHAEE